MATPENGPKIEDAPQTEGEMPKEAPVSPEVEATHKAKVSADATSSKKEAEKIKAELKSSHNVHGEEKKTGFIKGAAIGGSVVIGGGIFAFFASAWGLLKMYGKELFGFDIKSGKSGGGGGGHSKSGGHH